MKKIPVPLALLRALGYDGIGSYLEGYPFNARLIDWAKALAMPDLEIENDDLTNRQEWELLLEVGYDAARVTEITGFPWKGLIPRLSALPILVTSTYAASATNYPWPVQLAVCFKSASFGAQFLAACRDMWPTSDEVLYISGQMVLPQTAFQLYLPVEQSLEHKLTVHLSWEANSPAAAQGILNRFSAVLDAYDGAGLYTPKLDWFDAEPPDFDEYKHMKFGNELRTILALKYPQRPLEQLR